jgi:hypothetical protein
MRTIEKNGGFEAFMLNAKRCKMSDYAKSILKEIEVARAKKSI